MEPKDIRNKLNQIANKEPAKWLEKAKFRKENEGWLSDSFKIGLQVLTVIKNKGITKEQLAADIGVSLTEINDILKGRQKLTTEMKENLSNAIGVKLK